MNKNEVYTQQQRRFLTEFAKTLDVAQSAQKAGYITKSAQATASELLRREKYIKLLNKIIDEKARHLEITNGFIVKKYLELINWATGEKQSAERVLENIEGEDGDNCKRLGTLGEIVELKDAQMLLRALDGLCKQLNNAGFNENREENSMLTKIIGLNQERI